VMPQGVRQRICRSNECGHSHGCSRAGEPFILLIHVDWEKTVETSVLFAGRLLWHFCIRECRRDFWSSVSVTEIRAPSREVGEENEACAAY